MRKTQASMLKCLGFALNFITIDIALVASTHLAVLAFAIRCWRLMPRWDPAVWYGSERI